MKPFLESLKLRKGIFNALRCLLSIPFKISRTFTFWMLLLFYLKFLILQKVIIYHYIHRWTFTSSSFGDLTSFSLWIVKMSMLTSSPMSSTLFLMLLGLSTIVKFWLFCLYNPLTIATFIMNFLSLISTRFEEVKLSLSKFCFSSFSIHLRVFCCEKRV